MTKEEIKIWFADIKIVGEPMTIKDSQLALAIELRKMRLLLEGKKL